MTLFHTIFVLHSNKKKVHENQLKVTRLSLTPWTTANDPSYRFFFSESYSQYFSFDISISGYNVPKTFTDPRKLDFGQYILDDSIDFHKLFSPERHSKYILFSANTSVIEFIFPQICVKNTSKTPQNDLFCHYFGQISGTI